MCPRRIEEDHKDFIDVVSGKLRKALKKFIKSGQIVKSRGKRGKISISIPKIDIPQILYGDNGNGTGRGKGKDGDVIDKGKKGKGNGNGAGQDESEGITISLDLEEVLKFMQGELELPNLKPKVSDTFDEVKIKYNNISLVGPESLRHNRRTFLEALKRQAADGTINDLEIVPGCKDPIKAIKPIKRDKRYRQYKEIKVPSSNALIIYARDGSGSMDQQKCEIVSDMAWWIDVWIRRFYKRVDRLFVWHDSSAMEVDEEKFYNYRFGGGTTCSSALKFISKQFENRYPPEKWNIYVFYFTDGDNWEEDNQVFINTLKESFGERIVNLVGITQILPWNYANSIKNVVDQALEKGDLNRENIKTTEINAEGGAVLTEEKRNQQILEAIQKLMGSDKSKAKLNTESDNVF
jgi:uncharacterized sporulation protein YeaH/YhbH (DUF444 family)